MEESILYTKYRNELTRILDENGQHLSEDGLWEFEQFLRDNWSTDNLKLYRYSPADYYNIRNFETGKIRLTGNGVQNDVFEGLPAAISKKQINALNDVVYMKCFSTSNENTLMWSHYADSNRGFCVEYDIGLLEHTDPVLRHIFPVIYTNDRINVDIASIAELVDEQKWLNHDISQDGISNYDVLLQAILLFLFKGKDWDYECEWRILYSKADIYLDPSINVLNPMINFDCITGIYLGHRMDTEIKANIIEIAERVNTSRRETEREAIRVFEMNLSPTQYKLVSSKML